MDNVRYDVFICFRGDEPFETSTNQPVRTSTIRTAIVEPLFDSLTGIGASVFMDDESIESGQPIPETILQGILRTRGGGAALILVSPDFFSRVWPLIELACFYKAQHYPDQDQIHLFIVCFNTSPTQIKQKAFVTEICAGIQDLKFVVVPEKVNNNNAEQIIQWLSKTIEEWIKSSCVALGRTRAESFNAFKTSLVHLPDQADIGESLATYANLNDILVSNQSIKLSKVFAAATLANQLSEENIFALSFVLSALKRDGQFLDTVDIATKYLNQYKKKWLNRNTIAQLPSLREEKERVQEWFQLRRRPSAVAQHDQLSTFERARIPHSLSMKICQLSRSINPQELARLSQIGASLNNQIKAIFFAIDLICRHNKLPNARTIGTGSLYLAFPIDVDLDFAINSTAKLVSADEGVEFEVDATDPWSWPLHLDQNGVLNDAVRNNLALLVASFDLEGLCRFRVHRIQANDEIDNQYAVFFMPSESDLNSARSIIEQDGFMERFEQACRKTDETTKDLVAFCGGCGVIQRVSSSNPYLCRLGHLQALTMLSEQNLIPEEIPEQAPNQPQQDIYERNQSFVVKHTASVNVVSFSPDGLLLATASADDGLIKLWSVSSGQLSAELKGHKNGVRSVAFSPTGKLLVSGGSDNTVRTWSVASKQQLRVLEGHSYTVNSVAWSPNSDIIASGSSDKNVIFWDAISGLQLNALNDVTRVNCVNFSQDGSKLISGVFEAAIVYDVKSAAVLKKLPHLNEVCSASFSHNGDFVVTACDVTVRIFNIVTGQQTKEFKGHSARVTSVAFSSDGFKLASCSADRSVRLWDVKSTKQLQQLEGHSESVTAVACSRNGQYIASGSFDKTVILWQNQFVNDLQRGTRFEQNEIGYRELKLLESLEDIVIKTAESDQRALEQTAKLEELNRRQQELEEQQKVAAELEKQKKEQLAKKQNELLAKQQEIEKQQKEIERQKAEQQKREQEIADRERKQREELKKQKLEQEIADRKFKQQKQEFEQQKQEMEKQKEELRQKQQEIEKQQKEIERQKAEQQKREQEIADRERKQREANLDPTQVTEWSVEDVCGYFKQASIDDAVIAIFRKQRIRGISLANTAKDEVLKSMGIDAMRDRLDVISVINKLVSASSGSNTGLKVHEIPRHELTKDTILSDKSKFGIVWRGKYNGIPVAIKQPKLYGDPDLIPSKQLADIVEEATLMTSISVHPNVLHCYGISRVGEDDYLLITELCNLGSLDVFLQNYPGTPAVDRRRFSQQVARGLNHLGKHNVVHRDVAARNVLLHDQGGGVIVAKVCDFGLSLQSEGEYYKMTGQHLLSPETAPEVLATGKHSTRSDVWSFGVLLWEVESLCATRAKPNKVAFPPLSKPAQASDSMYTIMLKCWAKDPNQRPSFEALINMLAF